MVLQQIVPTLGSKKKKKKGKSLLEKKIIISIP